MKIFSKSTKPIYQPEELSISFSKEEFKNTILKKISKKTENPISEGKDDLKVTIYNREIEWVTQRRYIILECNKMTSKIYQYTNKLINDFIRDIKFGNTCRSENLTFIVMVEESNDIIEEFLKNTSVMTLYGLKNTGPLSYPVMKLVFCNDKNKVYIGGCDCNIIQENYYKSRVKEIKKLIRKTNSE